MFKQVTRHVEHDNKVFYWLFRDVSLLAGGALARGKGSHCFQTDVRGICRIATSALKIAA